MPKPSDATTKALVEADPAGLLAYAGLPPDGPVTVLSAELSAVTAEADAVLRVDGPRPWLVHIEFQTGRDASIAARLLRYNVLVAARHDLPVQSVVVLLRREADSPGTVGTLERRMPDGRLVHDFRYLVVRCWERPVEEILAGPLAPLAVAAEADLPGVIRRMQARVDREAAPGAAGELWTSTDILLGLSHDADFIRVLLRGVRNMKESSTYQAILQEGREEGRIEVARSMVLRLGCKRFGPPSPAAAAAIQAVANTERAEALAERVYEVSSWDELLATP